MVARDALGNALSEGDQVVFSLGFGQTTVGQVMRISSVLAAGDPNNPPPVFVQFTLPLPVRADGLVGGIVKAALPPKD